MVGVGMNRAAVWIAAALVAIGLSVVWRDSPSETDAAKASALDLNDAIQQAQVATKENE